MRIPVGLEKPWRGLALPIEEHQNTALRLQSAAVTGDRSPATWTFDDFQRIRQAELTQRLRGAAIGHKQDFVIRSGKSLGGQRTETPFE